MAHSQRSIAPVTDEAVLTASQLRVSLVISARNEARNLPHVLAHLPRGLFEVDPGRRAKHRRHDSRGPQATAHDPGRASKGRDL